MLFQSSRAASTAMERLATGSKINSVQDDVAGSAIADRMTSQVRGLNMAVKNVNDAMAMLSVADNAAGDITDMLQRMRELAIQAASDTNSAADRQYLQGEVNSFIQEIDRVATQTQYNGMNLLDGSKSASFQVGSSSGQAVGFDFRSLKASSFAGISSPTTSTSGTQSSSGPVTDLTAPVLTGITIDKSVVDVSNGTQTISVQFSVADESLIHEASFRLRHVETGHVIGGGFRYPQGEGVEGNAWPPISISVDENDHAGMYELDFAMVRDTADNNRYYTGTTIGESFPIEVVGGITDLTAPVLTGITIDKSVVDVSNGTQTISVQFSVADESLIHEASFRLRHVETGHVIGGGFRYPQGEGVEGNAWPPISISVDENDHAGMYELDFAMVRDTADNNRYYTGTTIGESFPIEVVGGDIQPTIANQSYSWSQEVDESTSSSYTPTGATSQSYSWSQEIDTSTQSSGYTSTGTSSKSYEWSLYNLGSLNITNSSGPVDAIASITAAIETVAEQRAEYGAMQNRLQYTISNLMSVSEQTTIARSRIEDADFATESAALAKAQVLQQSGAAMLAQANARPQLVLQLVK